MTPVDHYQALKRELQAMIKRSGPPSPDDYRRWYQQANVAQLEQGVFPEIRRCGYCGKQLEHTAGFVLTTDTPGPGVRQYCDERCRSAGKMATWRGRNPEAKLRRR